MSEHSPSNKGTILFIVSVPLLPVSHGGASRIWSMVDYLREIGFSIELVTVDWGRQRTALEERVDRLWLVDKVEDKKSDFGVGARRLRRGWHDLKPRVRQTLEPFPAGAWVLRHVSACLRGWRAANAVSSNSILRQRKPRLEEFAGEVARQCVPLAAVAEFAWTARALDRMPPGTLKILDTHDVQHLRAATAAAAGGDLADRASTREEEISELVRADVLLAIQAEEKAILEEMCPDKRVVLVEHAVEIPEWRDSPPDSLDLLFVGNLYDPNVLGVRQFLHYAWPQIRVSFPQSRFVVCGRVSEAVPDDIAGVVCEGVVPDLEPYYRAAAIVVNSIPYGTGLKIKAVEALAYGKCLVTTESGVVGLPSALDPPYVVVSVKEMGDVIVDLLGNHSRRRQLEDAAWRFARERLAPESVYAELVTILQEMAAQCEKCKLSP